MKKANKDADAELAQANLLMHEVIWHLIGGYSESDKKVPPAGDCGDGEFGMDDSLKCNRDKTSKNAKDEIKKRFQDVITGQAGGGK